MLEGDGCVGFKEFNDLGIESLYSLIAESRLLKVLLFIYVGNMVVYLEFTIFFVLVMGGVNIYRF